MTKPRDIRAALAPCLAIVLIAGLAVTISACGRKGSPVYPEGATYPEKTYPTPEATYGTED